MIEIANSYPNTDLNLLCMLVFVPQILEVRVPVGLVATNESVHTVVAIAVTKLLKSSLLEINKKVFLLESTHDPLGDLENQFRTVVRNP